jgi:hypothetical protein
MVFLWMWKDNHNEQMIAEKRSRYSFEKLPADPDATRIVFATFNVQGDLEYS